MKKLCFASVMMLFFTVAAAQTKTVGTDKALGVTLEDYKTYGWMANIDNIPTDKIIVGDGGVLIYNNASGRRMIKDAIKYELDARRLEIDNGSPDMRVNFMVFEKPGKLRTYSGYEIVNMGLDTVRTDDNISYTNFEEGTLLINFTDSNTNKMIWQGFASGILDPDKIKDQSAVREAVSSIFQKTDI